MCVLTDSHGCHVCADGHTRTHTDIHTAIDVLCVLTDTHGRPVCADGHPRKSYVLCVLTDTHGHTRTATDVLCVLANTHGLPVCTEQIAHVGQNHPNSPREGPACRSTGRASVQSPTTNVLICVLKDSHGRPVCADGHRRTHMDSHGRPVCAGGYPQTSCVHGRLVCADEHPQTSCPHTSCVCWRTPTDVLCVLNRQPTWPISPKQSTGRVSMLSPRTNVLICVLMDCHGRPVCAYGNTQTHTDSHRHPVCADGHTRTSCVC
ncbi:unnamed protein product [Brassica rapa]|uniref:Uncharacterized protein n=1 Tax=Brassica campestris TaxID=3711 RepID=A0A8D9DB10_BRACM|nr:unnamed protein product [Brassica rapa]